MGIQDDKNPIKIMTQNTYNLNYSIQNGAIHFATFEDYEGLIDSLEYAMDVHYDNSLPATLTVQDDIDVYLDSIEFDQVAPIKDWLVSLNGSTSSVSTYSSYFGIHFDSIQLALETDFSENVVSTLYQQHPSLNPAVLAVLNAEAKLFIGNDEIDESRGFSVSLFCENRACCRFGEAGAFGQIGGKRIALQGFFQPFSLLGSRVSTEIIHL